MPESPLTSIAGRLIGAAAFAPGLFLVGLVTVFEPVEEAESPLDELPDDEPPFDFAESLGFGFELLPSEPVRPASGSTYWSSPALCASAAEGSAKAAQVAISAKLRVEII